MELLSPDLTPFDDAELQQHIDDSLALDEASTSLSRAGYAIIRRFFNPVIIGREKIPPQPVLFVGNHAMFAFDGMIVNPIIHNEIRRYVRVMADKMWFSGPARDQFLKQGMIIGDPAVCGAMMDAGKDLMVFPGGAVEANKTLDKRYTLCWRERYGFVRLAALHGYTIVPFCTVGPDEMFDRIMEGHELPGSNLGKLLKRVGLLTDDARQDLMPPVPKGLFNTLIPKPQRCYLAFGDPVDLTEYKGGVPALDEQKAIRKIVADDIEANIKSLLLLRAQQQDNDGWLRKLLTR